MVLHTARHLDILQWHSPAPWREFNFHVNFDLPEMSTGVAFAILLLSALSFLERIACYWRGRCSPGRFHVGVYATHHVHDVTSGSKEKLYCL